MAEEIRKNNKGPLFQKYLESHSITLMADDQKLPCICID